MVYRQRRETYEKMTVERVRLVPEEAVLGGCKTSTTSSAFATRGSGCVTSSCVNNANS
jgi:hypothetical protein